MQNDAGEQQQAAPCVNPPPRPPAQTGEGAAGQQRVEQQQRHANDPGKSGRNVDRLPPGKQGACRRDGEGNGNGSRENAPDHYRAQRICQGQAGCRTKSAVSVLSSALDITGRRNTVWKSPLS